MMKEKEHGRVLSFGDTLKMLSRKFKYITLVNDKLNNDSVEKPQTGVVGGENNKTKS